MPLTCLYRRFIVKFQMGLILGIKAIHRTARYISRNCGRSVATGIQFNLKCMHLKHMGLADGCYFGRKSTMCVDCKNKKLVSTQFTSRDRSFLMKMWRGLRHRIYLTSVGLLNHCLWATDLRGNFPEDSHDNSTTVPWSVQVNVLWAISSSRDTVQCSFDTKRD